MNKNGFDNWAEVYKIYNQRKEGLMWPSETLIRLMMSITRQKKEYEQKKILDIGFGNGNNLIYFNTLGMELYGTEVHEDICKDAQKNLHKLGVNSKLSFGTNRKLDYRDSFFDYIVSWNVLHYENNEQHILQALKEYCRVLKPGGRFFISTTGPRHKILKNSKYLGNNRYLIGREGDFRKGETFFYFSTQDNIQYYFEKYFTDITIGRMNETVINECVDYYIISGIKDRK